MKPVICEKVFAIDIYQIPSYILKPVDNAHTTSKVTMQCITKQVFTLLLYSSQMDRC